MCLNVLAVYTKLVEPYLIAEYRQNMTDRSVHVYVNYPITRIHGSVRLSNHKCVS